jgi:site-specific DNA-methyltransferase (adenine-specific)
MNSAYNIDCMEAMQRIPDKWFDLAVADPPYFSGPERRGYYGNKISPIGVLRDYPVSPVWKVPAEDYFKELERVCKYYIVFGCNYFDFRFPPGRIVWDKCNGNSSFSDCEIAATNCHNSVRLFRYMWNGMMQGKSVSEGYIQQGNKALNEKRIHPTQKPAALYTWLFSRYAKPGGKILDTHLGSGSSRIAAYEAGLDFIGFEIDPHYFAAQEQRFSEHIAQFSLFCGIDDAEM